MNKYVIIFTLAILAGYSVATKPLGFGFEEYKLVMNGFLLGIGVPDSYMATLLACLTDQKHLEMDFVETMDKIDKLDFTDLPLTAELFSKLFDGLTMSIVEIDLCAPDNEEYDRIFQKIYHLMPQTIVKRLMLNFISNAQQTFKDIQDAVDNYLSGKFKQVGTDLGDIMHLILLYRTYNGMSLQDYIKLVQGLLKGMNVKNDVEKIIKCIANVPDIVNQIGTVIEMLKNIDLEHIKEIVDAIMKIFAIVKDVMVDLSTCAETVSELKVIVEKLSKLNLEKIMERVTQQMFRIVYDVMGTKDAWERKLYDKAGEYLGDVIYRLLLATVGQTA